MINRLRITYLLPLFWAVITVGIVSCSRAASYYSDTLDEAEKVLPTNADSAMTILDAIDPSDLKVDSLRAKYHYLRAYGHMRQNRSMIADSLIASAHEYYRGKRMSPETCSAAPHWLGSSSGAEILRGLSGSLTLLLPYKMFPTH